MSSKRKLLQVIGEQTLTEYRRSDASLAFAVESVPVSCKKGCAACCKQLVSTSMREVAAIAAAHPKKLLAQRKKLEEQVDLFGSMVVKVFGPGTYPAIDSKEAAEEFSKQNEELADLWWAAQVSCVFLRDDNTCSVYDARPISCRGYFVRTDPARCFELQKTEVEAYNFNAIQFLRLRLMEQSEGSYTLMYLPTALLMALKNM